jgi:hypothetical protein
LYRCTEKRTAADAKKVEAVEKRAAAKAKQVEATESKAKVGLYRLSVIYPGPEKRLVSTHEPEM